MGWSEAVYNVLWGGMRFLLSPSSKRWVEFFNRCAPSNASCMCCGEDAGSIVQATGLSEWLVEGDGIVWR